jgi:hypothetical protein
MGSSARWRPAYDVRVETHLEAAVERQRLEVIVELLRSEVAGTESARFCSLQCNGSRSIGQSARTAAKAPGGRGVAAVSKVGCDLRLTASAALRGVNQKMRAAFPAPTLPDRPGEIGRGAVLDIGRSAPDANRARHSAAFRWTDRFIAHGQRLLLGASAECAKTIRMAFDLDPMRTHFSGGCVRWGSAPRSIDEHPCAPSRLKASRRASAPASAFSGCSRRIRELAAETAVAAAGLSGREGSDAQP